MIDGLFHYTGVVTWALLAILTLLFVPIGMGLLGVWLYHNGAMAIQRCCDGVPSGGVLRRLYVGSLYARDRCEAFLLWYGKRLLG